MTRTVPEQVSMRPRFPAALALGVALAHGAGAAETGRATDVRPAVIEFGASVAHMQDALEGACMTMNLRELEVSLPDVGRQQQIDCEGFEYFGAPRLAEFVFGDDRLMLVWILTEADELDALEAAFAKAFGPPTHRAQTVTAYADAGAGVRRDRPEAGFYAPELSDRYRAFFDAQAAAAPRD